jgi:glycosyltransferase involved in cell wall biosynthesis
MERIADLRRDPSEAQLINPATKDACQSKPSPICILHSVQTPAEGGNATGVRNLVQWLQPPEFRHVVVVEGGNAASLDGAPVHVVSPCNWWRTAERIVRLRRMIAALRIDLVHGRGWPGADALIAGASIPGVALVLSGHGFEQIQPSGLPENESWRQRAALRLLGRRLTCAYASAPDVACRLADDVGWPRTSVPVMVAGVDTDQYHPAPPRGNGRSAQFRIGVAGHLRPVKRPDLILDVVRGMTRLAAIRAFHVEIAGGGPLLSSLRDTVKSLGLQDLISLPGPIGDMPAWYCSLDAVVVPSDYEACSNVILEAMASGLPVVATDVGLTREVLDDGAAGLIVPRDDATTIFRALERLMSDPVLAAAIGCAARERVLARYSLVRRREAFAWMYREAVGRARRFRQTEKEYVS